MTYLTPVTLIYVDDPAFARGGLVDTAEIIKRAGRNGDTEIIHVNKDELAELRAMWGEPTINPQTGCPEYFLKKLWKGVKKVIKPIAPLLPIAAAFIPGVGPLAAAAIGAASGGITGGVKGALVGGALGGLGASGAVGKAVGSIAPGLSPLASRAATGALMGGLGSAVSGGNVLNGALMGGATGAAIGPGGLIDKGAPTFGGGPNANGSMSVNAPGISGASDMPFNVAPGSGIVPSIAPTGTLAVNPQMGDLAVKPIANAQPWTKRPFLGGAISPKINNLAGWGTLGALALSQGSKPKSSDSGIDAKLPVQSIVDNKFQQTFGAGLPAPKGNYANLAAIPSGRSRDEELEYGFGPEQKFFAYARGGSVENNTDALARDQKSLRRSSDYLHAYDRDGSVLEVRVGPPPTKLEAMEYVDAERRRRAAGDNYGVPDEMAVLGYPAEREGRRLKDTMPDLATSRASGYHTITRAGGGEVAGPGTGRSDDIDAKLSDGEYVMDAETVALLGDGSSKAGAKRLDAMRVNLRKHKGASLAKGKFSVKAKAPERYLHVR